MIHLFAPSHYSTIYDLVHKKDAEFEMGLDSLTSYVFPIGNRVATFE